MPACAIVSFHIFCRLMFNSKEFTMLKSIIATAAILTAAHLTAAPLASFGGPLSDKLPGWEFKPSASKNGLTYNQFEGYYPDKGGKLISRRIILDKKPGEAAYYRIKFDAEAKERAYQGVDFYDSKRNLLPDNYDVIYPGERRSYDRVIYAMPKVDSIRVFFQSKTGLRAWNLSVEKVFAAEAAKYCDRVYEELPPLNFKAPPYSMELLPKTRAALNSGKPWHVLMLGDSIMQDTFHSQFHSLLKREFPNSEFDFTISMRGSTGCWFYCQADQFKKYVLDEKKPDLLVIGGISNYRKPYHPNGTEAIEVVIRAAKAHYKDIEILVLSAPLAVDTRPWDKANPDKPLPVQKWELAKDQRVLGGYDPKTLPAMARRNRVAFWDLSTPTYTWLYASGTPHEWYSRDYVHSGERGKQVIGRALMEYFKTAK